MSLSDLTPLEHVAELRKQLGPVKPRLKRYRGGAVVMSEAELMAYAREMSRQWREEQDARTDDERGSSESLPGAADV